ncbi:hypothetical protein M2138_000619 [Dysgonomonadaceae bacterium PH5-43]|nr:hypothetical protein [Dysgonomonadaceae bacterium PH5-43]
MKKIYTLIIAMLLIAVLPMSAQNSFLTAVPTVESLINSLPESAFQIKVKSATASSYYAGQNINKAIDGDFTTIYHSAWGASGTTTFPTLLTFNFAENTNIDYVTYTPRQDNGVNGHIMTFELFCKKRGETNETKIGDYNFAGNSTSSTVRFLETIENVEYIKFSISSGTNGYVACAEMQFFQNNKDAFDYKSIFTDMTCSELKAGVTINDINNINGDFYKKHAQDIYYGAFDKENRLGTYEAYLAPEITTAQNKAAFHYGKRDNPTGIYAKEGETIIVFADESNEATYPSLFLQETEQASRGGMNFVLQPGLNKITAPYDGLMYILYYTSTGNEAPVKINIITGTVNGYFDIEKHTNADWQALIDNATFRYFDVKGNQVSMTFDTDQFRQHTAGKIVELVNAFDEMVKLEWKLLGLTKYNREPKTRQHLQVMPSSYSDNFMHATNYYTGYNREYGTQSFMLNVDKLKDASFTAGWAGGNSWGPAHEIGHVNQLTPVLKWSGMTEVTNNIMSQYVTRSWGLKSRLNHEVLATYGNRYNKAIKVIVEAGLPHNYMITNADGTTDTDVFCKLVPFWQLKLYMHDVLGNDQFYPDTYEKLRVDPTPSASNGSNRDGMCQLNFTKIACQVAGLDLTEFFQDWGFYTPVNRTDFIVTQTSIDIIKAEIAGLGLPKPKLPEGKKLYQITDDTVGDFKVE